MTVTSPAAPPALEFRGLSMSFGATRALRAVDFAVAAGEVHGLVGHNGSGKSTLIKCLAGFHAPDAGSRLWLHGDEVSLPTTPGVLEDNGVSFVHQNLGLFPRLSVAENLWLSELATGPARLTSTKSLRRRAAVVLADHGLKVEPAAPVSSLSAVQRANLALIRAATNQREEGGVLVLDEPTAFLPPDDRIHLYEMVRRLAGRGHAVVFVSHFLDEVISLCGRVSVLRDGVAVATGRTTEGMTPDDLAALVVGQETAVVARRDIAEPREATAVTFSSFSAGRAREVDLAVKRGEIVGLAGLMGSGYDDLLRGAFGLLPATGTMDLEGGRVELAGYAPNDALGKGLSIVPVDRAGEGLALELSVADNVSLPVLPDYRSGAGGLSIRRIRTDTDALIREHGIRGATPTGPVSALSGGNAQKALLVKAMRTDPDVLLLCDPTQGVDVGARIAIQGMLAAAAAEGLAILWASSDADELAAVCHRVAVMRHGRIVAMLQGDELDADRISAACLGASRSS